MVNDTQILEELLNSIKAISEQTENMRSILNKVVECRSESETCSAQFLQMGYNKINVIKAVREVTQWNLKFSKDWVESMPHFMNPLDTHGLSKSQLKSMVEKINAAGGHARMTPGKDCETCRLRFICYTE